jgi:hypothetical protein
VLWFEGDEVDEHVDVAVERLAQGRVVVPVDLHVSNAVRERPPAAASDHDVPSALLQTREQGATGLAAAAEQERAPRHRADDSSLIS